MRAAAESRTNRLALLACVISLVMYLLCSRVVPRFWQELTEAIQRL